METINKYLYLLRENHISFEGVYLYGSYAKGNPQKDSDIDLAIIAEEWQPDIFDAFDRSSKIVVKGNRIYVLDTGNCRIQVFEFIVDL